MKSKIITPVSLLGTYLKYQKNKLQSLSKNLKTIFVLAIISILSSCSKSDSPAELPLPTPVVAEPQTFTTFVEGLPALPASTNSEYTGIVYSPLTKNLYISSYIATSGVDSNGYKILQLNTETKQYATVYNSPTTTNYGHANILRIFGNSIYVPIWDYNNGKLVRLDGIGTNTLSLGNTINLPQKGIYDIAIADKMYLLDFWVHKVYRGDSPNFTNVTDFSVDLGATFNSSILYTTKNSTPYLIQGSRGGLVSAYNPLTGAFIRSVNVPTGTSIGNSNSGNLERDSQNRIYSMTTGSIVRYSADLLTREVFDINPANGFDGRQFAIAEEGNKIRIYYVRGTTVSTMTITN